MITSMCWAEDRSSEQLTSGNLKLLTLSTSNPPLKWKVVSQLPLSEGTFSSLISYVHIIFSTSQRTNDPVNKIFKTFNYSLPSVERKNSSDKDGLTEKFTDE